VVNGVEQIRDISGEVISNAHKLGIDAVISIGGDGSLLIAHELSKKGMKIVGVPKTIDNDVCSTETTFGFDTALVTVTDAIDKIHTTADSHHRVMVIEVMGRDAGWIALEAGIAGGAHIILIPEIPFTMRGLCGSIRERESQGKRFTIVVVAEGVKLPSDLMGNAGGGSVGNIVGDGIASSTQKEVRVSVLGHIQRGGSPSPFDRILGTRFGVAATELIAQGKFGQMVCLQNAAVGCVDIAEVMGKLKRVDPNGELVHAARAVGICFAD
jgi:6-phosphofructokinase 1